MGPMTRSNMRRRENGDLAIRYGPNLNAAAHRIGLRKEKKEKKEEKEIKPGARCAGAHRTGAGRDITPGPRTR
jgi:hypothetical protein